MEIWDILDEIEDIIKSAIRIPFSGKAVIDAEFLLEKIDRIRAVLPGELEEARTLLEEQQQMFNEASRTAQQIIDESKYQAARIIEHSEITRQAESVSKEIVTKAEELAREIKLEANQYAEELLTYMERVLREGLNSIQKGRSQLKELMDQNLRLKDPKAQ